MLNFGCIFFQILIGICISIIQQQLIVGKLCVLTHEGFYVLVKIYRELTLTQNCEIA